MAKALVETTSSIFLIDPMTRDEVQHHRPSVVSWSSFIEQRLGCGQIRLLASGLPDTVTDADFAEVLKASDGNQDLAREAFLAEFAPEPEIGVKGEVKPVEKAIDLIQPVKPKA